MPSIHEPIAIIGTGCRFPGGCDSPSKLWELLRDPRDLLKEIPEDRFSADGFYHPKNSHHGTSNVRHSYLLDEDLRRFDAQFFGIKATEANSIDPQQRLLMETVYEGIEAAGLSMKQLQGSDTAVYVGVMSADFTDMIGRDVETFPTYFATGTARSILSNRLSYFFDWHGPSMTIDTACSSSLIAMHQAVQTLRSGQASVAVVAGSNLILGPEQYIAESKLQMLSPTGRSRMWDADADGYARGEGVAAIVLKPLSRALADGDHIECVIRETGVNQDGKTPGITMPSAVAQAALIRSTYSRAGLDISKASDRPQFFEAHGTGTPAGDPIEAEAICTAFFGEKSHFVPSGPDDTLFVGSIKTVVGHTEGTAGLAAVIKASLALQSGEMPPNRLFNRLNPNVEPFYGNLNILSATRKWPKLAENSVRRVSVNSFGFGGANCHAILESADSYRAIQDKPHGDGGTYSFAPYVFSAATDTALVSTLEGIRNHLASSQNGPGIDLRNLAWTLYKRRTTLACRTVITAARSVQDLIGKLDESILSLSESSESSAVKTRASNAPLRVLGVFTGQGAQWPRMGAQLIENSPAADSILQRLDQSLRSLPLQDRPSWSLREQLLASAESSLVGTASLSQPLCTAVQIMLVDLLKAAGVHFSAVVGHSSGEIGAAYASGYLSAEDAIRVTYYRGLHLKLVTQQGAMLAVGTSYEDATELCSLPAFEGRVCVAASNSPSSVTLSGDAETIDEVKVILDEEKKFNRLLKVDRAYHSHHMQECAIPYVRSLEQLGIKVRPGNAAVDCRWISSVFTCDISEIPSSQCLDGSYWASNLVRPVRFAEALQLLYRGCTDGETGSFDLAIEVGPHPALKGPATQTIQECTAKEPIPYTGLLERGTDSIESFSKATGYIWKTFGDDVVDFAAYDRFAASEQATASRFVPVKGLPTYPWDHNRTFWHESRLSKAFRARRDRPHELLGRQVLDGTPGHMRWRNVFKRSEIDWLDGHQVQGQTVFPCAGYVSACIEACMRACAADEPVQSIELRDFNIGHAMVFEDDDSGLDALITLSDISRSEKQGRKEINAHFSFHSAPNSETLDMASHASCQVLVIIGDRTPNVLPPRAQDYEEYALLDVEEDRFYDALGGLGFGYSGPFRALKKLRRRLGSAQGFIQNPASTLFDQDAPLLIHPATLDSAIQSIMLAFCYPGDSMLRSIYLPTSIRRLIVNPLNCLEFSGKSVEVPFDSAASVGTAKSLSGDASVYSPRGFSYKAIQLEGLQTRPLSDPTQSSELNIFTELTWDLDRPDCETVVARTPVPELDADLLFSLERVAYFYLRKLGDAIPPSERVNLEWHFKRLFAYVDHVLPSVARGSNPFAQKEWMHDTQEVITEILDRYPHNADLRLMRAVGDNIVSVVRGETVMLEPMVQDNKLNDFYVHAEGMHRYTAYLAGFASQIGHRYPHMSVLEIGAGTGGATKSFLRELGDQFATYTFTDISGGFFEKASTVFASYSSKMSFRVLDIEKDIDGQGFTEGSFDVIIASLVLHATRDLAQTMHNVRKLLKPGGYLLLLEITENEQMRFGLLFGGLPGWWLGYDDGRALSPCIGLDEWERLLKQTGFSGIDTVVPHEEKLPVPLSVIVSQAVDGKVEFLRRPLHQTSEAVLIPRLTIIGGGPKSTALASEIQRILASRCGAIRFINSLQSIQENDLVVGGSVLCLSDIDGPIFKSMEPVKLRGFQEVFKQSTNVLWITCGARAGDPYSRMVVGFGRTIVLEMLHLRLQFLDLDTAAAPDPSVIAEALLRFEVAGTWEESEDAMSSLLHSTEPELSYSAAGKAFVPRFKLNKDQNDRYKSGRRTITKEVDVTQSALELFYSKEDESYEFAETDPQETAHGWFIQEQIVEIRIVYSINRSVRVAKDCFLFPVVGENTKTGKRFFALSPKSASKVAIPKSFILLELEIPEDEIACTLELLYSELLGRAALADVSAGTQILLVKPSDRFGRAIDRLATDKGASLVCFPSRADTKWEYIQPMTSRLAIQNILLPKIDPDANFLLIDMGEDQYMTTAVVECLPPGQRRTIRTVDLISSAGHLPKRDCKQDVRAALTDARYAFQHQRLERHADGLLQPELPILQLEQLVSVGDGGTRLHEGFLISWRSSLSTIPVSLRTIDTKVGFRSDRTYWLVGLTGGLGLSLCAWMARQGARYIAITSRSPKVDGSFLQKMKTMGVTIEVIAADVCDRNSVQSTYIQIVHRLPPIAGVAQGAMVLHDTMFLDLDTERIDKVTKPKIQGSTYLEEIFHNTDLEFFVFFSSMACVTGNPGQSAYAAANMFMSGLAAQRRQRGLNASAVHIGAIFGNGYVTRELSLAQQQFLKKVGNLWLSEQDFHNLFAEAVYAGQSHRGRNPELSTGLMIIEDSDDFRKNITWFRNPMFQHCVRNTQGAGLVENAGKGRRGVLVKVQLQEAVSPDDVRDIIYESFSAKLQASLQVEEGRPISDLTADNLGIDSLVAVDIRSWFIKEFQVEIPVLKILSGATVGDILARVQELLPRDLTPNLDPNAKGSSKSKQKVQKAKVAAAATATAATSSSHSKTRRHNSTQAKGVNGLNHPVSVIPKRLNGVASGNGDKPDVTHVAQAPATTAAYLRTATSTHFDHMPDTVDTGSSTASYSQADVPVTDFADSKLSSSSTSWSEIDEAETGSGYSELSAKPPNISISECLQQNKLLENANSTVGRTAPISFAQSRFWFLEQFLETPASALNITLSIDLQGPIQVEKLRKAVSLVGQRHEALRTRFSAKGSEGVVQEVLASSCLSLETHDINAESQAEDWHKGLAQHKYRLSKGENMRILLLRRSSNSFRLLIGYHHINMDGISLEVVLRELQLIYDSHRPPSIRDIIQYPDFAEQQRREYESGQWKDDLKFWKEEFLDQAPPVLPLLPLAKTQVRLPLTSYSSNTADFHIDQTILATIQSTCSRLKINQFHFHLAVFYALLTRLLDVEDFCIGISSANRHSPQTMQSVGMYLNILPLLLKTQPNQTFANAVKLVRDKSLAAFGHSTVPFDVIVNELGLARTASNSPLFQVLVNYRPGVSERRKFCDCQSEVVAFDQGQTAYDLALDVIENPGGDCRIILSGQSVFYGDREMTQLKGMYLDLLKSFSRNPASRLSAPPLYDPEDVKAAIELGRGPKWEHRWPATLVHRIDHMIERYGSNVALKDGRGSSLTYLQMAERVKELSLSLIEHQTHPIGIGSRVGVFLDSCMDWVCSLLAILRLGATYVPLDATAGLDRLVSIVQDCKPDLLLVNELMEPEARRFQSLMAPEQVFNIDAVTKSAREHTVPIAAEPGSLAALMYTSGSTGVPKGIMMRHDSFRNSIEIMTDKLSYKEGQDVTLQQSSYSFDMSLCQIFLALSNGGTLHIVPRELRGDPVAISSIISREGITFTTATPSELNSWIRYGDPVALRNSAWRVVQSGGEPVRDSLITSFRQVGKPDLQLVDCYGPTEITFCCHSREVDYQRDTISGATDAEVKGLQTWPNCSVYILDNNQRPVPAGVAGEVAIGGSGVVAGYLHSELDTRGFKRDSWASNEFVENGWTRLQRTGDIGQLIQTDGSLILGERIAGDTQIKLRGLRIDLREIESAIFQAAEGKVSDAYVTVRQSKTTGADCLIAFAVPTASHTPEDLSRILDRLPLPQYMRPAALMPLEKLPTNSSGKIDRLALKSIPFHQERAPQVQLLNDNNQQLNSTESRILQLWEQVISHEVLSQYIINKESDFFHVGGSSILLVQLRAELEKIFERKVSLFRLFEASTLGGMAALLVPTSPVADPSSGNIGAITSGIESDQSIDWEAETAVSPSLLQVRVTRRFFGNPSVVVLTGSTGFLGQAILKRLLEDSIVQKIHCLAVRRDVGELPKLFNSPKVIIHRGDLATPCFGLSEEVASSIFSEAHAVIHNGADVSFMKSYASLKPVNVDSTRELVRLSLPYHLSFHYISTASVVQLTGEERWEQQSVKAHPPPPAAKTDGYIATKWASERYLEKISDQCALPIWIHRPSSIKGPDAPQTDLMTNLLRFAKEIKAVPDTAAWKGWLDFVSVESAAMQIVDEVYEDYSWPGNVKYLYESGEEVIPLADLRGVLGRETRSKVEELPMEEWAARAEAQGMSVLLGEYLRAVAGVPLVFTLLEKDGGSWS
ncbi:PKS-NRPS hybrid [Colletotrichum zoysiae]|uniref:PKS-NRPS hybrid n=1 Tax=Colletotrichum zoysiae TaxID=1216348 RepID=A0AAD9M2G3_9PEZI|nr:PKS-NRPS hybrid [Colletotrichum zoysiae]